MRSRNATLILLGLLSLMTLASAAVGADLERKIVIFLPSARDEQVQRRVAVGSGAQVVKALPLVNGLAVALPRSAVQALVRRAEVARIDDDLVCQAVDQVTELGALPWEAGASGRLKPPPPQPDQSTPWGVDEIDAPAIWASSTGLGARLAIVDTGIDSAHPDLMANVQTGFNALNPRKPANDDNGHGTHVAGTAGAADNAIGVAGVAPSVSLYPVKVLNRRGFGRLSDFIEGLDWCINNGMDVINISLSFTSGNQAMLDAILKVHEAGIVMVAAAGNNGETTGVVEYPAQYPDVIAVAGTTSSSTLAFFSSWGFEVDIAAPGTAIWSTIPGGLYTDATGTSMAAPHVSGVVALRHAYRDAGKLPQELPEDVMDALQSTATDLGAPPGRENGFGAGLVNAPAAVLFVKQ